MSIEVESIILEDGKYELRRENYSMSALRYGEPWRDLVGDKMVNAMFDRIRHLEAVVAEVHSWAVCAPITTEQDMMQNINRVIAITTPEGGAS